MTFVGYLRRVRLNYALNRIINTDDTLQRIALESGFSSQSVFTREFRKYYVKSPTEIRAGRKRRKQNERTMDKRGGMELVQQTPLDTRMQLHVERLREPDRPVAGVRL